MILITLYRLTYYRIPSVLLGMITLLPDTEACKPVQFTLLDVFMFSLCSSRMFADVIE